MRSEDTWYRFWFYFFYFNIRESLFFFPNIFSFFYSFTMSYFNTISPTNDTTYSSAFPPLQSLPLTVNHHHQYHKKAPSLSSGSSSSSSGMNIHSGSGSLGNNGSPFSFFTSLAPPKFPSYLKHTAYAHIVLQQYNDRKCKKQPSSDMDLRLPQYWNKISKPRHPLQIGINGYDLSYNITTGLFLCFFFFFYVGNHLIIVLYFFCECRTNK